LDLRFLVYDSYKFDLFFGKNSSLFYLGYFPLTFYFSIFDIFSFVLQRFSPMAKECFSYFNKFFRRQNSFFFDLDFHITLFLSKGVIRIRVPGYLNFFRYKVQEYFLVQGLEKSIVSVVQVNNDSGKLVSIFPFFRKRFFFFFLDKVKSSFIYNLFNFFSIFVNFCLV
jgi:hypothetical protein